MHTKQLCEARHKCHPCHPAWYPGKKRLLIQNIYSGRGSSCLHDAELRLVLCDSINLFGDLNVTLAVIRSGVGQVGCQW